MTARSRKRNIEEGAPSACFTFLCSVYQCLLCAVQHLSPLHSTFEVSNSSFLAKVFALSLASVACMPLRTVAWKAGEHDLEDADKALTRRGLGSVMREACPVVQPMVAAAGIQQRHA